MLAEPGLVIEGGDLACGELLMLVHRRIRAAAAGTVVCIASTDPAGPIDVPAWCHLTGHHYLGRQANAPDRYLIQIAAAATAVAESNPWRPVPAT
ncbi:MAG: sulfurtransferase TusA family protein [Sporichthyaceae bacterium]